MIEPADHVRHGYTLATIDHLAKIAVRSDRWTTAGDTDERYAAIWHALAERILTAEQPPTREDLFATALSASDRHVREEMHHHGWDVRDLGLGGGSMHRFQRYWNCPNPGFDDAVVERIALGQVWAMIPAHQQDAIRALAATDDHELAAKVLGLKLVTYSSRLRKGRMLARSLWHEHETPALPPRDKRLFNRAAVDGRGRARLTQTQVAELRARRAEGALLKDLAAEVGYTPGGLCTLLVGKRRAAPDPEGA